ncbi:hypothetical protein B0J13DRAFT_675691 [Dactylonectria estremocensis]|uniref:Uncharacterized protein n=1 Tax=Dactylonectria estremocensis TaxID=1079267 RepID=A0A9P9ETV1_9HYPO|nr:hypothetical protein B0J13DRAFT_675691 [Dactylonectria estremocensis]
MHSSILLSVAVSFLGLDLAFAGPCRPVSTPDASVSVTTPSAASTPLATPTETPEISITPSETPTSTLAEISTTSSAPLTIPTAFNIVASTGAATNKVLRGRLINTSYITFDNSLGGDISLGWEESTGRLLVSSSNLYLCGLYNLQPLTASILLCSAEQGIRIQFVTCEPPTGPKLKCSIPGCRWDEETVFGDPGTDNEGPYTQYTQVCDPAAEPWTNLYSRKYTGSPDLQWLADIGPEGATGDDTLTPIDFLVEAI